MPAPKWLARVNRRVFNPMELRRGARPVITHTGRSSAKTYETPLDAHAVDGGFIFILVYGPQSDWVQNIMASGTASLRVGGEVYELVSPRLIPEDEARAQLPDTVKAPPAYMNVTDYLRMDVG
jgi:deazaflavin-dependent oxidoreductase (nitroreductase family)